MDKNTYKKLWEWTKSITFALAIKKHSWCHSSVGRAKDWKSLCPRFDSWWHHDKKELLLKSNSFFVVMVFCCGGGITKPFCKRYKIRHIQMCTHKNDPHIWASLRGLAGSRAANIRILIDNTYFSAWKITQKWISLKFLYLIMLNRAIKPCSFYKTRKNMRKNVTFALSIPIPKAPMGRHIYI